MAHGCVFNEIPATTVDRPRKWKVRKRDGIWGVYPPQQCCPALTCWDFDRAIWRAQNLAARKA